eukprot:TRINITY_DN893_c0_g1_i2.p1 TRINITY_DN893_c0_g1~~TRINITY_DN893_c0_g1_i2.p1  ORF type:complete len:1008 (+),score=174.89 TRINITY_DN893_c0_g1_i2:619-3642(+)
MLVFGGYGNAGAPLNDILLYSGIENNTWTHILPPNNQSLVPPTRYGHCAVMVRDQGNFTGESMWVFGGGDRFNQPLNDLWVYSMATANWTQISPVGGYIPTARSHMSCNVPVGDCIIVFGGKHPTTNLVYGNLDKYCFATNTWTSLSPTLHTGVVDPPLRRWGHSASVANKRILVFGGYEGTFPTDFLNDFWSYDQTLDKWIIPTMLGTPPAVRRSHKSVWLDSSQRLYIYGGRDRYFTLGDITTSSYAPIWCPGGFYTTDGDSSCANCTLGSFSIAGAYNCTSCPRGTYAETLGSSTCLDCPAGFYNEKTGSTIITDCDPCTPGSFSTVPGATTVATCESCPRGKFQANSGQSFCSNCTAGTASAIFGSASSTTCNLCQPGLYSPQPASTSCTPCEKGTFTGVAGLSTCAPCNPGGWSGGFASSCTGCAVGKYNPSYGSTTAGDCINCDPGTYADVTGLGVCRNCSMGSWGNATAQTTALDCYKCDIGKYSDVEAATTPSTCRDCLPGSYADSPGFGLCALCPNGTYSSVPAATTASVCTNCTAGQFNPAPGRSSVCDNCPSGTWSFAGYSFCVTCSGGSFLPTGGTSIEDCTGCESMFFGTVGQANCTACPNGTYSMNAWTSCAKCDGSSKAFGGSLISNPHFDFQGSWVANPAFSYVSDGYPNVTNTQPFGIQLDSTPGNFFQAGASQTVVLNQKNAIDLTIAGYSKAFNVTGVKDRNYGIAVDILFVDNIKITDAFSANFNPGSHDWEYAEGHYTVTKAIKSVDVKINLKIHQGRAVFDDIFLVTKPSTSCTCNLGTYWSGSLNSTQCMSCPAGSFCRAGSIYDCPYLQIPTIFSFGGQSSCSACYPGWRCEKGLAAPCAPLTEYHDPSDNTCKRCPDGSECVQGIATPCEAGSKSVFGQRCVLCEPGYFNTQGNSTACLACPAGTTSGYSRTFCYDCEAGEYSGNGDYCRSCPIGSYSNAGDPQCSPCPPGFYGNVKALRECFKCPVGTTSPQGATDVSQCV